MPTENERKALWFLAIVALSGSGVRLWRAQARQVEAPAVTALERQLERADSAHRHGSDRAAARKATRDVARGTVSRRERRSTTAAPGTTPPVRPRPVAGPPGAPVDLDSADSATIEALPGIGPALASRIVAYRDSVGSFGDIDALCDVRGIGPGLVKKLRPLVTFTGPRRPLGDACGRGSGPTRESTPTRRRKPG